jgi:hypothetical protein
MLNVVTSNGTVKRFNSPFNRKGRWIPVIRPLGREASVAKWSEDLRGHPDWAEKERAMFEGFHSVRPDYDIAPGGIVIGRGAHERWQAPIAHPELPQMVAKLETADDAGILAFYRAYGSLGFISLTADPDRAFYTWPNGDRTMGGDPLDWVRTHARTVRVCFAIIEALQQNNNKALEHIIKDPSIGYAYRDEIAAVSASELIDRAEHIHRAWAGAKAQRRSLTTQARVLRNSLINPNIARIHRQLIVTEETPDASRFTFRAQIEIVYWHLANVIEDGIVARCKRPGCHAFFIQRHRSQEYCAPRYGQRESPCALWVRQQRLWKRRIHNTRRKRA